MDNIHLFQLINSPSASQSAALAWALLAAQWLVYVVLAGAAVAWARADDDVRVELAHVALAGALSLLIAEALRVAWPHPRPAALHLGTQYLATPNDSGLPNDHATLLWALALRALGTRSLAVWSFPLLTLGLVVGISRVYLGVNFPFDVLASFPVAVAGSVPAWLVRRQWQRSVRRVLARWRSATDTGPAPPPA